MRIILIGLLLSFSLFANDPKVEVTSFRYVAQNNPVAELCGKISNVTIFPAYVKIIVDGNKNPGIYNVVVDKDAKFCIAVVTYYGIADVSLWGSSFNTVQIQK